MNTARRILALLMALTMIAALTACGRTGRDDDDDSEGKKGKPAVCEISSFTQSYNVKYDEGYESSSVMELRYSELGLVTSITAEFDGESETVEFSYGFDDHDVLNSVSGEFDEEAFTLVIENSYEHNRLVEAVITDIVAEGESFKDAGYLDAFDPDSNYVVSSVFSTVKNLICRYTAYRDCTLRFGDTGMLIRYEDGRVVYDYSYSGYTATEMIYEYTRRENTTTTNSYQYLDGEFSLMSSTTIVEDSKHQVLRASFNLPGIDVPVEIGFRFEDRSGEQAGETIREGFVDEDSVRRFVAENQELLGDVSQAEIDEALAMIKDRPLYRYTLDKWGRIVTIESLMAALTSSMDQTNIRYCDEQGRVIRQETAINSSSYSYLIVIETEYR